MNLIFVFLLSFSPVFAAETCLTSMSLYKKRSAELEKLKNEDQADRPMDGTKIDWKKVEPRDLKRRKKVAQIFAEGCLRESKDYLNAALIFQHGSTPDHFYQTFIWASQAMKMGDTSHRPLIALGVDRYLVKSGQKQLFGSQFAKDDKDNWCIEPVETSFSDEMRQKYLQMPLKEYIAMFLTAYKSSQSPEEVHACAHALGPSPAGTVPGFW